MGAKSVFEDVVLTLLWAADKLSRPTLQNLTDPSGPWDDRHGLQRHLARMEQRQLLVRQQRANQMVYQLTSQGHLEALGGKDVVARWGRPWDGRWRQVLFDLPATRKKVRMRFWRWLRENGFGYLQQSVWIHPDPVQELVETMNEFRDDVESFILMEATCCAGYSNQAVVNGAWDFAEINKRYATYIAQATISTAEARRLASSAGTLGLWLRRERMDWWHALSVDPLLPRQLWPKGYRGEEAWKVRIDCLLALTEQTA